MRVAVFDLDGTLADTSADLIAAANATLEEAGFGAPLDVSTDQAFAFAGGRAMLRIGVERAGGGTDEAAVARCYPRLLAHYAENIDRHTFTYEGVDAALDALAATGWGLGVCTNKPEALAETLLTRLGLRPRFQAMLGADSLPFRKPDPRHLLETIARVGGSPDRAVLVGDTVNDRAAARAAGVPCVLVTFGPLGHEVAEMEPEALLDHFDALPDLLDRIVPPARSAPAP